MQKKHNAILTPNAKELRKNMTPQERHLWYNFLHNYPIHFLRQKVIVNYIVDFYCAKAKLVIELDGSQHYTPLNIAYDEYHTQVFHQLGLQVIRFSNNDIDINFNGVCEYIDHKVKQLIDLHEVT